MKKIRILHTADLHLDTSFFTIENKTELLKYELLETFTEIIEIAERYEAQAMVICGDITDGGVMSDATYNTVKKIFDRLDIPVFLIMGNHDDGFNYNLPENVHLFNEKEKYSIENVDIYGYDFDKGIGDFNGCDQTKINIMLLHGTVNGNTDNPIPVSFIQNSKVDYVALGHIHKFSGLQKAGNTFYAYSGVPQGRGFDETGEKGVIIADIEKDNVEIQFVPVGKRQYCEVVIDATDCYDYVEILEKINGLNTNNLYKFKIQGSPLGHIDFHSLKAVLKREYFYVKVIDETRAKVDITSIAKEESLAGYFVKNVLSNGGDEEVVKYGLSALKGERIYIDED